MAFEFEAKALDGRLIKGEVDASTEAEARVKLRAQQLMPMRIIPKAQAEKKKQATGFSFGNDKVSPKELQVFTRQFAVLVGAGVPIVDSLEAMTGGGKTPAMNKALTAVVDDIGKGKRLADAMKNHPLVFDRMYVNLVRAGEEGGVLDEVLNRLAAYIEKSNKLKRKIYGALWYPAAIILVAILVIVGLLVFVVPKLVEMIQDSGGEIPAMTQMVLDASDFVVNYWYIILASLIIIPFSLSTYYKTKEGREVIDQLMIDTPLFGSLVQKGSIARFSRTLATLLAAGVRIIDSLEIAAATAGNFVIETCLNNAKDSISKGRTLTEPLRKTKYIPDMVAQMISVGEQTGNLDVMLSKIADFYEDEVETTAEALTSLIEPLLMVFLGGVIAVIVVAMYLPTFNMAGTVG